MHRLILIAILNTTIFGGLLPAFDGRTEGKAGYYADSFEGRAMANGEPVRQSELTTA